MWSLSLSLSPRVIEWCCLASSQWCWTFWRCSWDTISTDTSGWTVQRPWVTGKHTYVQCCSVWVVRIHPSSIQIIIMYVLLASARVQTHDGNEWQRWRWQCVTRWTWCLLCLVTAVVNQGWCLLHWHLIRVLEDFVWLHFMVLLCEHLCLSHLVLCSTCAVIVLAGVDEFLFWVLFK